MINKPSLIDKSLLKPKIEPIIEPKIENIEINFPKLGELDKKSLGVLINITFIIILGSLFFWIYTIYIERKEQKITELKNIEPRPSNIQSSFLAPQIILPSNKEKLLSESTKSKIWLPDNFTDF